MKHSYPTYYNEFRCIAADCPDSCCQGWDVVIDSDTEAYYNTVPSSIGKKLREMIYTDPDGDSVFHLAEEKKCPFWGEDKLCDIYRELGEEHLCATCRHFPRITMDYTTFTEHTLALACPEAARLILTADNAYREFDATEFEECEDYSAQIMRLLLKTRSQAAKLLQTDQPLKQRFEKLLRLAQEAQRELTVTAPLSTEMSTKIYNELEYIDENNRAKILKAVSSQPDLSRNEYALTNLALYWLYRYWFGAIDTLDVIAPTRFIISAVGTVAALAEENSDITVAAQMYSKEIEQSYENMERLWDASTQ